MWRHRRSWSVALVGAVLSLQATSCDTTGGADRAASNTTTSVVSSRCPLARGVNGGEVRIVSFEGSSSAIPQLRITMTLDETATITISCLEGSRIGPEALTGQRITSSSGLVWERMTGDPQRYIARTGACCLELRSASPTPDAEVQRLIRDVETANDEQFRALLRSATEQTVRNGYPLYWLRSQNSVIVHRYQPENHYLLRTVVPGACGQALLALGPATTDLAEGKEPWLRTDGTGPPAFVVHHPDAGSPSIVWRDGAGVVSVGCAVGTTREQLAEADHAVEVTSPERFTENLAAIVAARP
jgi:hypothetical protein